MADTPSFPPAPQQPGGADPNARPGSGQGPGPHTGPVPGWAGGPHPMPTAAGQPPAFTPPSAQGMPTGGRPSRRKACLTHGATAVVALIFGAAIGGSGEADGTAEASGPVPAVTVTETAPAGKGADAPEPAVTVTETVKETVTAKPKPTKKPGPPASFDGDGQYLVGEDIQAGTYKTAGPQDDSIIPNCYWARLKDASGEFDAIIANDNLKGQGRVTLNKGEYFQTNGCQKWEKAG
ncbi:hypothetical protein [Streptomyces sp. M92]|uniref:hypothetical protein n=1 Tax=Streptomyces sp. M92 TaxID=2944250 RepID=UPI00234B891A|nr:hypothetical protein [Streptomyces sp. M92]WCN07386.1 hypothetical protein M6G08_35695 [Streptomyces sp. M92]